jgi:hypothetical protein
LAFIIALILTNGSFRSILTFFSFVVLDDFATLYPYCQHCYSLKAEGEMKLVEQAIDENGKERKGDQRG